MKFIIVDKATLNIMGSYEADVKDDTSANRSWLMAEPKAKHLELPENLSEELCEAVLDEQGEIRLQYSETKELQQIDTAWVILRNQRNALIEETDKLLLSDYPISEEELVKVKNYRQALRDLPNTIVDPRLAVKWPKKPTI